MESKAREHLRILAAKNKLRREHAERAVSPGAKVRAAKEAAFQTHLRGANSDRSSSSTASGAAVTFKQASSGSVASASAGGGLVSRNSRAVNDSRSLISSSPRAALSSSSSSSLSSSSNHKEAGDNKPLLLKKGPAGVGGKAVGSGSKWGVLDGRDNASTIYFATAGGGKVRVGKPGEEYESQTSTSTTTSTTAAASSSSSVRSGGGNRGVVGGESPPSTVGDHHRASLSSPSSSSSKKRMVNFSGVVGTSTDDLPLPTSSFFFDSTAENAKRENIFDDETVRTVSSLNSPRHVVYNKLERHDKDQQHKHQTNTVSPQRPESPLHAAALETAIAAAATIEKRLPPFPGPSPHYSQRGREGGGGGGEESGNADILSYLTSMMQESSSTSSHDEENVINFSGHGTPTPLHVNKRNSSTSNSSKKKKNVSVSITSSSSPPPPHPHPLPQQRAPFFSSPRQDLSPQPSPTKRILESNVLSPSAPISHSPINIEEAVDEEAVDEDRDDHLTSFHDKPLPTISVFSPSSPSSRNQIVAPRGTRPPASPPPPPPPPPLHTKHTNGSIDAYPRSLEPPVNSSFASGSGGEGDESVIDPLRSSWMPLPLSTQLRTTSPLQKIESQGEGMDLRVANTSASNNRSTTSVFTDVPSWRETATHQSKLASRLRSKTDRTRGESSITGGGEEEEEDDHGEYLSSSVGKSAYDHILQELREEEEYEGGEEEDEDINEGEHRNEKKKKNVIVVDTDDIIDTNEEEEEESFDRDEEGGITTNEKHRHYYGKPDANKYFHYENNNKSSSSSPPPPLHEDEEVSSTNRPLLILPQQRCLTPVPIGSPGAPVLALNFNDSVLSPGSVIVPSTHYADTPSSSSVSAVRGIVGEGRGGGAPSPSVGVGKVPDAGFGETFSIPNLPRGRLLRLRILSTWGGDDGGGSLGRPVAGLTGVEFFSSTGELIPCTATATKNEIPPTPAKSKHGSPLDRDDYKGQNEYEEDEDEEDGLLTGASKLLNGNNITCDPQEMFRCYFDPPELGAEAEKGFGGLVIEFDFGRKRRDTALAMARIYNYNRSRVHSYCGARLVRLELDGKRIFEGELRRAPGNILGDGLGAGNALRACSETILFTVDPEILSRVEANDPQADRLTSAGNATSEQDVVDYYLALAALAKVENERPATAEVVPHASSTDSYNASNTASNQPSIFFRRLLKAAAQSPQSPRSPTSSFNPPLLPLPSSSFFSPQPHRPQSTSTPINSSLRRKINISDRHIDPFLEEEEETDLDVHHHDKSGLVIDEEEEGGEGVSLDDDDIINARLKRQSPKRQQLDRDAQIISELISGLEIDSEEVDAASTFLPTSKERASSTRGGGDSVALQPPEPPTHLSPSSSHFLSAAETVSTALKNLYEPLSLPAGSLLPTGRVLTLRILTTHGDPFYAGLTGLEVRALSDDASTIEKVEISQAQLHASPSDINGDDDWSDDDEEEGEEEEDEVKKGAISSKDVRTVDKLVDGVNVTTDDTHMWLIPYSPPEDIASGSVAKKLESTLVALPKNRQRHVLTIDLGSRPRAIALIKVWNYNKSLEDSLRGVRHCSIELDGVPLSVPKWRHSSSRNENNTYSNNFIDNSNNNDTLEGRSFSPSYDVFSLRRAPGVDTFDFGQTVLLAHPPPSPSSSSSSVKYEQVPEWKFNAPTPSLRQPLLSTSSSAAAVRQDTIVVQELPVGQLLRFVFPTGLGDPHYIGIDAIAIYDAMGIRVPVRPCNVHALPSLSSLESSSTNVESHFGIEKGDSRISGNLGFAPSIASSFSSSSSSSLMSTTSEECIFRRDDPALYIDSSSPSSSFPASRSWLYPLLAPHPDVPFRGQGNELVFLLDDPVRISLIRIFNYSKTPARGAGSVQVWLEGNLIFLGELQPAPSSSSSSPSKIVKNQGGRFGSGGMMPRPCSSIAFTSNPQLLSRDAENGYISYCGAGEQGVVLYNDNAIVGKLSLKQELALRALKESHKAGNVRPRTSILKS